MTDLLDERIDERIDETTDNFANLHDAVEAILFTVGNECDNFNQAEKTLTVVLDKLRAAYSETTDQLTCDVLKFEITAYWVARHQVMESAFMAELSSEKANSLKDYQEKFRL